jgi:glutathione S-transferase-like protein
VLPTFAGVVTATAYADTEADYNKAAKEIPVPFERLEKALAKQGSGPYFNGAKYSLVDAAYAPFLQRYFFLDGVKKLGHIETFRCARTARLQPQFRPRVPRSSGTTTPTPRHSWMRPSAAGTTRRSGRTRNRCIKSLSRPRCWRLEFYFTDVLCIGRIGSFLAPAVVGLMLAYGLGGWTLYTFAHRYDLDFRQHERPALRNPRHPACDVVDLRSGVRPRADQGTPAATMRTRAASSRTCGFPPATRWRPGVMTPADEGQCGRLPLSGYQSRSSN